MKISPSPLEAGIDIIRGHCRTLPDTPGVYRMLGKGDSVLYIGKAKSLRRRVGSYLKAQRLSVRMQQMLALTLDMEFVHTHTEAEALLLESNLIKKLKPRYNILLRDDKSYPYILIADDHPFPVVAKHRGARKRRGRYYGPFAGALAVNQTIAILQRAFMLRNCSDNVFSGRSRPCLQYHIKRCTAPCVGRVGADEYALQVREARDFLEGRSAAVQARMARAMQEASANRQYEKAAGYRDRIQALTSIQSHQDINVRGLADADVLALAQQGGESCVQVFFFRAGRNYGNRSYFPRHDPGESAETILAAFIAQFYADKPPPGEILVTNLPEEKALIEEALRTKAGHRVKISCPRRGARHNLMLFAARNAGEALARHRSERAGEKKILEEVGRVFNLEETPRRIEVFDNSHITGTNMVGAMIVAGPEGFRKNAYRKFNIRLAGAADDYAMMREVLSRRFKKALSAPDARESEDWPDIVLIDGGRGQLSAARAVLEDLGIADAVTLIAIAKGADRHAGRETFHMEGRAPFRLRENDPALHYLQRLRDEAHRFAIGAHRTRRAMQIGASPLDDIPGIGPRRKKALLNRFGSAKAVAAAGVRDLMEVEGISRERAQVIYDHFH